MTPFNICFIFLQSLLQSQDGFKVFPSYITFTSLDGFRVFFLQCIQHTRETQLSS